MKTGDLVTRRATDPRIGLVSEARKEHRNGKTLVRVLWNTGQTGNYFAEQLEDLCK